MTPSSMDRVREIFASNVRVRPPLGQYNLDAAYGWEGIKEN